jgi:hypothetical protein
VDERDRCLEGDKAGRAKPHVGDDAMPGDVVSLNSSGMGDCPPTRKSCGSTIGTIGAAMTTAGVVGLGCVV